MTPCGAQAFVADERGMATVEAAIAIAAIVVVLVLCLGAVLAASMQIRCVDAAREAARLTARGDGDNAVTSAQRVAPTGADIGIGGDGDLVIATVSARVPLLPLLQISARAAAAREPDAQ